MFQEDKQLVEEICKKVAKEEIAKAFAEYERKMGKPDLPAASKEPEYFDPPAPAGDPAK